MFRFINYIFSGFFKSNQIGSILLFLSVAISLLIANSFLHQDFDFFLQQQLGFSNSVVHLKYPLLLWINDGLMAVFFLLVGLEIKRELVEGELSSPKRAALPVFAAIGGMLVPALIYMSVNYQSATIGGWGIPMATDIVFALAIISILGKKVPASLKIFLAALAIVDDLGAILVIALFYTSEFYPIYLAYAAGILGLLMLFNYIGITKLIFYIVPGFFLWYFVHQSGVHATIAGVLLALTVPTNKSNKLSPLEKLEHQLSRPVNLAIMPVFALANTNIHFEKAMFTQLATPLTIGIILGLFLGKPLGILLFSWLSVKLKLSKLPHNSNWKHIQGTGLLAGIGFTMSVFIAMLSFSDSSVQAEAKLAILLASIISGVWGYFYLSNIKKRADT